ncbi:MAG: hypothetical protein ACTSQY_00765 [Candidatus Odinarchaeia archaeon]
MSIKYLRQQILKIRNLYDPILDKKMLEKLKQSLETKKITKDEYDYLFLLLLNEN